jgi:hypothetical protein
MTSVTPAPPPPKAVVARELYELLCRRTQRPGQQDRPFEGLNAPEFAASNFQDEQETRYLLAPPTMMEGIYTCRNCGSKKTQSWDKQTRSSDEPMTTFIMCMNCRKTWTQGG